MAWKIYTLEWGNRGETKSPGEELGDFLQKLWPDDVKRKWVPRLVLRKEEVVESIGRVDDGDERIFAIYSNGANHHYTYGLCKTIADKRSSKYTYYHFDFHTDDYAPRGGNEEVLGNAAFVGEIVNDTNAIGAEFIGCDSAPHISSLPGAQETKDAYISMDLDFMSDLEIETGYVDGGWRRDDLLSRLDSLLDEKNIISADCLGYKGHEDAKSILLYACICGKIIGKDIPELEKLHDLAKEGKLDYNGMYEALGLPPNEIEYEPLPFKLFPSKNSSMEESKFGRHLNPELYDNL